jgi:hypothetical protein
MRKKLLVLLTLLGLVGTACGESQAEVTTDAPVMAAASDDGAGAEADAAGDDDGSDPDEQSALGDTATTLEAGAEPVTYEDGTLGALMHAEAVSPASGRFEGAITLDGPPGSGMENVSMTMSGSFDSDAEAMELSMDLSGMATAEAATAGLPPEYADSFAEPLEMRVVDGQAYIKWGLLAMFTGDEGSWLAMPADELSSTTGSYGIETAPTSPTDLLEAYAQAAATSLEDLGTETVRGVETQHWRAVLDLATMAGTIEGAEGAEAAAELEAAGLAELPVDLWIGTEDGKLHKFETTMTVDDGVTGSGTMAIVFEMYDLGAAVDITPPPADQITDGAGLGTF